jgi:hypothetical protein
MTAFIGYLRMRTLKGVILALSLVRLCAGNAVFASDALATSGPSTVAIGLNVSSDDAHPQIPPPSILRSIIRESLVIGVPQSASCIAPILSCGGIGSCSCASCSSCAPLSCASCTC